MFMEVSLLLRYLEAAACRKASKSLLVKNTGGRCEGFKFDAYVGGEAKAPGKQREPKLASACPGTRFPWS